MSVDRPRYYSIEPTRRRRTDHTHTLPPALLVFDTLNGIVYELHEQKRSQI